ncbi:hypothetical protein AB0C11_42260 [Streptomyces sp. NPDC039016]|uniref:hypothetical protein n=1 Tax=Streptomyces sp. NPDC039016 TaxID=3154330 RepID=UPI0033CAD45F
MNQGDGHQPPFGLHLPLLPDGTCILLLHRRVNEDLHRRSTRRKKAAPARMRR